MTDKNVEAFWRWFGESQSVIADEFCNLNEMEEDEGANQEAFARVEKTLDDMVRHLHMFDARLFPYCGLDADGKIELIFTAEGNVNAFANAHAIVQAAPVLDNWKFTALKPRMADSDPVVVAQSEEGSIDPDMIQYSIVDYEGEKLLLLIFQVGDGELEEQMAFLGINMVESLLGEQDLATGFDGIDAMTRGQFDEIGNDWKLSPLSNLVAEFDNRRIH
jgi:hypothetical protein